MTHRSPTSTTRAPLEAAAAATATSGPIPEGQPREIATTGFTFSSALPPLWLGGRPELVACAAQSFERELLAQLGAQAPNVDVDRAGPALVAGSPDLREELLARERLAAALAEESEQRELFGGQRDGPPLGHDLARGLVDDDLADLEALLGRELASPPLERADARVELGGHVGHEHEVVEAGRRIEARHLRRGERDDGPDAFEPDLRA